MVHDAQTKGTNNQDTAHASVDCKGATVHCRINKGAAIKWCARTALWLSGQTLLTVSPESLNGHWWWQASQSVEMDRNHGEHLNPDHSQPYILALGALQVLQLVGLFLVLHHSHKG